MEMEEMEEVSSLMCVLVLELAVVSASLVVVVVVVEAAGRFFGVVDVIVDVVVGGFEVGFGAAFSLLSSMIVLSGLSSTR